LTEKKPGQRKGRRVLAHVREGKKDKMIEWKKGKLMKRECERERKSETRHNTGSLTSVDDDSTGLSSSLSKRREACFLGRGGLDSPEGS
jgi:hypothetical protein